MPTAAIITAAGSGIRFGGEKQFKALAKKPLLFYSIDIFLSVEEINFLVIVVPKKSVHEITVNIQKQYNMQKIKVISGDRERQGSVFKGINAVPDHYNTVIIHDGVRPFISKSLIKLNLYHSKYFDGVVTAIKATDTIKFSKDSLIDKTIDRNKIWMAQTPQTFNIKKLIKAYKAAKENNCKVTDESSLMEKYGYKIKLIEGSRFNIKITSKEDWEFAKTILDYLNEL